MNALALGLLPSIGKLHSVVAGPKPYNACCGLEHGGLWVPRGALYHFSKLRPTEPFLFGSLSPSCSRSSFSTLSLSPTELGPLKR